MKKRNGCLLSGLVVLLLLFCAGTALWFFLNPNSQAHQAFVQIRDPQSGILTDLNETLPLDVYAEASRPILRLEVYADGVLIAAVNGSGQKILTLSQPWVVSSVGRHVLVARAFFSADEFADSQVVFVDTADLAGLPTQVNVDDLPRGQGVGEVRVGDLAAAAGTSPEQIARLNPGLSAAPEAVIPSGTLVSIPRRANPPPASPAPAIPPPAPDGPGMHPEVPVSSRFDGETHSCTQVSLRWSDAPDESGYLLYRLAPGEDAMTTLARLPANQTTYTDTALNGPGAYHYMLAPQRPSAGSITSMQSISLGPECAPAPAAGMSALRLVMLRIRLNKSFDGIYCYTSLNGSRYERIPADDALLRPSSDDWSVYQLPVQIPSRGAYSLSVPSDGTVDIAMECWGRLGPRSDSLGKYIASHPNSDWDGRELSGWSEVTDPNAPKSYVFNLSYRIARPLNAIDITRIYEGALAPQYVNVPPILDPLSAQVSNIPSPFNVALEWGFGCDPYLYLFDPLGYQCRLSTPRIRWSWFPSGGVTSEMLTGFNIRLEFSQPGKLSRRLPGAQFNLSDGRARELPSLVLPVAYRCGTTVYVTVTARTTQGSSAPSAPLIIRLPECKQNKLRIRINSIVILPSRQTGQLRDDGDICILCDDRRLEVFGSIYLNGYGVGLENFGHGLDVILFGACPATTICVTEGQYSYPDNSRQVPWLFEMDVPHNGTAILTVSLFDYDTENSPDLLCQGSAFIELGPLVDRNFRRRLTVTNDFGEAFCSVNAELQFAP